MGILITHYPYDTSVSKGNPRYLSDVLVSIGYQIRYIFRVGSAEGVGEEERGGYVERRGKGKMGGCGEISGGKERKKGVWKGGRVNKGGVYFAVFIDCLVGWCRMA